MQELGYLARVENIVASELWAIWNQSGVCIAWWQRKTALYTCTDPEQSKTAM